MAIDRDSAAPSLPVVGVVSDVTERAVMCKNGRSHHWADPTQPDERLTRWADRVFGCGPHYVAERRVITTEWQRVEEQR